MPELWYVYNVYISRYLFTEEIVLTKAFDLAIDSQYRLNISTIICIDHFSYLVLHIWLLHVYYGIFVVEQTIVERIVFYRNIDTIVTSNDQV